LLLVANVLGTVRQGKTRLADTPTILAVPLVRAMVRALNVQRIRAVLHFLNLQLAVGREESSEAIASPIVTEPISEAVVRTRRLVIRLLIDHAAHVKCADTAHTENR